jgi:hypothetical protein
VCFGVCFGLMMKIDKYLVNLRAFVILCFFFCSRLGKAADIPSARRQLTTENPFS